MQLFSTIIKKSEVTAFILKNERDYAAATNNISIIDTINKSVINGHYGEVFKSRDSAIITRRAMAINIVDNDSLFIHADTLIATGPSR